MEKYLINHFESLIILPFLKKYENNIEVIKESAFNKDLKIKVSGTEEELEPIKTICKNFKITLYPIVEEEEENPEA